MPDILFDTGTISVDSGYLTGADRSALVALSAAGTGTRLMFDRRIDMWADYEVRLFTATFADGLSLEMRVNTEFGPAGAAMAQALYYAETIGRLPTLMREDAHSVSIHKGDQLYGGGSGDFLIHTGQTPQYQSLQILEEVLMHEAAHISLDADIAQAAGWARAQTRDDAFVSQYAADNPVREDVAETFLLYWALRAHPDRVDPADAALLEAGIPARIAFLDGLGLNLGLTAPDFSAAGLGTGGRDVLFAAPDGDRLAGLGGGDRLMGGRRADQLDGNGGRDRITGGGGRDDLDGGGGADRLNGQGGNDTLTGGAGNDRLKGGQGADTFVFAGRFGKDTVQDFSPLRQGDLIDLTGAAGITGFRDLRLNHLSQTGADAVIADGQIGAITLENVEADTLTKAHFLF